MAFTQLKKAFSTAPILQHPNPNYPFILEVDASETEVGAVLSQQLSHTQTQILPATCFVNAVSWDFDQELNHTMPYHVPEVYPPPHLRNKLITWVHTAPATSHLGTRQSYDLIQEKYWWPNMMNDINKQVTSCSICAQVKVPQTFPSGKLYYLWYSIHGHTQCLILLLTFQSQRGKQSSWWL